MEEAAAAVVVGEGEEVLAVEVAWNHSRSLAVVADSIAAEVVQTHLMDRMASSEGSRIVEMDADERVHHRSSRLDHRHSHN